MAAESPHSDPPARQLRPHAQPDGEIPQHHPSSGPTPLIEVAAGLVFRQGRLLITQRPPEAHLGGLWEFPGGKRHPEETFEQCLERELREELGIEIAIKALYDEVQHHYHQPEKRVFIRFFLAAWRCHEPRALGCHDWRWVTAGELDRFNFPAADAALLAKLRADFDRLANAVTGDAF